MNYWYVLQFDIKYAYFNFLRSLEINAYSSDNKDGLRGPRERKGHDHPVGLYVLHLEWLLG